MNFFTYILYSKTINRYYIGHTSNLQRRMLFHEMKLSRYTKQCDDWRIMYYETFSSRREAVARELFIKKQKSRKFIQNLILEFKLSN